MKVATNITYCLTLLFSVLISCSNEEKGIKAIDQVITEQKRIDEESLSDLELKARAKVVTDSLIKDVVKSALFDTVGLFTSPVKVLKFYLYQEEYSQYKNISLTYKNMTKKKVEAIRFRWYGLDAFGEPADMGGYGLVEGFGGGFTDDALGAGKARTSSWGILSRSAKKVVFAWPIEVVFSDGIKWDISNPNEYFRSLDTLKGIKKYSVK